jgi:hypothetical protein
MESRMQVHPAPGAHGPVGTLPWQLQPERNFRALQVSSHRRTGAVRWRRAAWLNPPSPYIGITR